MKGLMEISLAKKYPTIFYILLLLIVSYTVEIIIIYQGGMESEQVGILPIILMFLPTVFALLSLYLSGKGWGYIDWKIKPNKLQYLIYGAFIPASTALLSVFLISYFGWGKPSYFFYADGAMHINRGPFVLGAGQQHVAYFLLNYFLTALVFSAVNGLAALGEEIGWRGYLQKILVSKYGVWKGVLIVGLVWGFWHFPIIVSGYNYPRTPVLGAFLFFPLTAIFGSFFLGWLTINARSVWPAVIAHGSVNTFFGYIVSGMDFGTESLPADLLVIAVWFITAVVSFKFIKKELAHQYVQ